MAKRIDIVDVMIAVRSGDLKITVKNGFFFMEHTKSGECVRLNEAVHCQICQYSEPCKPYNKVWCPKIGRYMKADGFCSEGVKKDG